MLIPSISNSIELGLIQRQASYAKAREMDVTLKLHVLDASGEVRDEREMAEFEGVEGIVVVAENKHKY